MTEKRTRGKYTRGYKVWVTEDHHKRLERRQAEGQSKNSQFRQGLDLLFREDRLRELELTEEDLNA